MYVCHWFDSDYDSVWVSQGFSLLILQGKVLPSADDHDQSSFFPYIIFKCPLHFQINGTVKSVHSSSPGEGICKIAKEVNADLIITGTRGMGSVRRTLLGSVSDYILHHAHVPVIVCRHWTRRPMNNVYFRYTFYNTLWRVSSIHTRTFCLVIGCFVLEVYRWLILPRE